MVRVGVVGYGYWGPNLVRNFVESPDATVSCVSDLREERLQLVKSRYGSIARYTHHAALLEDTNVDAVAIATPVFTHYDIAMAALRAGKHVLVEKPLASNSQQAASLIEEAQKRRLVLMVDHTFIYTGAVRKIRELVMSKRLGDIYYYDSVRINLGLVQPDVSVVWDLAVHDISIMGYVLSQYPVAVSATGVRHVPRTAESIAYLTLFFNNNLIAHIHVNWLAPVKVRRTLVGGSEKMIVYDDVEPSEKVKVYDKGVIISDSQEAVYNTLVSYRSGDMWAPKLDNTEALRTEVAEFVRCINTGSTPVTDGYAGLQVLNVLEAATASMRQQARPVEVGSHAEPARIA